MFGTDSSTPARRTRARLNRAGLAALLALGCAVSEPPSGGPEDRSPPAVKFSVPRPDSTGVDPSSAIRIGFNEAMTQARVERLVATHPPIRIAAVRWEDNELVLEAEGGLARDTTYVVRVKPGYRDRHGVTATAWHEFAFATGAAIDSARIEGAVRLRREPSAKGIVRCFRVIAGDTLDPLTERPDRETATGPDGRYVLGHLPSGDARFRLMAFVDQNGNGVFDLNTDPVAVRPDTVVLVPHVSVVRDVDFAVVDPAEPGVVRGVVTNETGIDSARVMVWLFAGADSTRALFRATCDSSGAYEMRQVKPGEYMLRGFVDVRADSLPGSWPCPEAGPEGCPEPGATLATPVVVKPGEWTEVPALSIRRREEP
jgi:hypothetical protein